ncbi:MAG: hypothetical protein GX594_16735 [Pirellulaceae bacterium]|nr:hypothetical protein [Pirellulaceae bacterium]
MSIKCECSNGHVLKVKDSCAGKVGLCPICRVPVRVPQPEPQHANMSEDAILHLLGHHVPPPRQESIHDTVENLDMFSDTSVSGIFGQTAPKKCCDRCNQEITVGTHICPHCHTYIANLKDF